MWQSKTKQDLMIEIWEKLDCESIGDTEIEAIEIAVAEEFGKSAVESPMRIARLLADEGAELRHTEILKLDVKRRLETPYAPMFLNLLKFETIEQTESTIRKLENLRQKFAHENDKEGMRLLKQNVIKSKETALELAGNQSFSEKKRNQNAEIAEWLTIWLGSPEVFENWVALRKVSVDFKQNITGS